MPRLVLDLYTEQPVLVSSLQGDPNSTVSLPYLTGSMIRGAWIGAWIKHHQISINSADPQYQRLFFNGATRFLNAYPLISGERSLPASFAWKIPKRQQVLQNRSTKSAYAFQDSLYQSLTGNPANQKNTAAFIQELAKKYPFMSIDNGKQIIYVTQVETLLAVHSSRSRRKGRAIKPAQNETTDVLEHGAVFQYESLAAGQTFRSYILGDQEDLEALCEVLKQGQHLWLGRSRSAGYGRVSIAGLELESNKAGELSQTIKPIGTKIYILALSDLILRNAYGDSTTELVSYLREKLGKQNIQATSLSAIRPTIIGGFNRTWGMPLPQLQAVQAGSACLLEFNDAISTETQTALLELQTKGIGERRAEGFGQILVGLAEHDQYQIATINSSTHFTPINRSHNQQPFTPDLGNDQAQSIWQGLVRQRFEQRLLQLTGATSVQGTISNSQLSQLWLAARECIQEPTKIDPKLGIFADKPAENKQVTSRRSTESSLSDLNATALQQFRRTIINTNDKQDQYIPALTATLPAWLGKVLYTEAQHQLWNTPPINQLANHIAPHILKNIEQEYTLRLIMALVKQKRRTRRQEAQEMAQQEVQHDQTT